MGNPRAPHPLYETLIRYNMIMIIYYGHGMHSKTSQLILHPWRKDHSSEECSSSPHETAEEHILMKLGRWFSCLKKIPPLFVYADRCPSRVHIGTTVIHYYQFFELADLHYRCIPKTPV